MRDEVSPTLPPLAGFDLPAYRRALVERFNNPALRHRTWQIAMDGSQKLPQRLLGTIRDRIQAGAPYGRLALGVAAWMRYARGIDEAGKAIDVRDPLSARIAELAQGSDDPEEIAKALLGMTEIFGDDLGADPDFKARIVAALSLLLNEGSAAVLRSFKED